MILLDTCAIIWDATNNTKIHPDITKIIDRAEQNNQLVICDISFWEIAMLIGKNRLNLTVGADEFLTLYQCRRDLMVHAITPTTAVRSVEFDKRINNDPADRLIVATAIELDATLITADNNLLEFSDVKTLWQ